MREAAVVLLIGLIEKMMDWNVHPVGAHRHEALSSKDHL